MAWRYGYFAERYGWPPDVVDRQPLWVIKLFPVWAGVVDEAKAKNEAKAQAEAEARAKAEAKRRG